MLPSHVLAQVGLPNDNAPAKGSLWEAIYGPVLPLLEGAWWVVLHLVLPAGLIIGVGGMIAAGIMGHKNGMARFRGVVFGVPMALFVVCAAVLVSNWVITSYPHS